MKNLYDSISKAYLSMLTEELTPLSEDMLMEDRIDVLKNTFQTFDTSHDPYAVNQHPHAIIDHFANNADPTRNKVYTQYLLSLYKRGAIKQHEAPRIKETLSNFDKYKNFLQPDQKQISIKNYPTIDSIDAAVAPHLGKGTTYEERREIFRKNPDVPGHKLEWEDDKIRAYSVTDKEVSQNAYASLDDKQCGAFPTKWCTARKTNQNMFDFYKSENPHYDPIAVHRKSDGAVFQYHVGGGEFKDHNNSEISKEDWDDIKPSISKMWLEKPHLLFGTDVNTKP
jgi:hypothetical protein